MLLCDIYNQGVDMWRPEFGEGVELGVKFDGLRGVWHPAVSVVLFENKIVKGLG